MIELNKGSSYAVFTEIFTIVFPDKSFTLKQNIDNNHNKIHFNEVYPHSSKKLFSGKRQLSSWLLNFVNSNTIHSSDDIFILFCSLA